MLEKTKYYEVWMQRARLRPSTLHQYVLCLVKFDEFLVDVYDVTAEEFDIDRFWHDQDTGLYYPMDRAFLDEFVEWLESTYIGQPSMPSKCYRAAKNFFATLKQNGLIGQDPTVGATPPAFYKSPKGIAITHQELEAMINAAFRKDPFTKQYVVMVLLLAVAGLRNQELRFLTSDHVILEKRIAIIDQGQKTAPGTVRLAKLLHETLEHYLNHPSYQKLSTETGSNLLFMHPSGQKLWPRDLIDTVKEIAKDAGITKNVTPHALRRTLATEMYRKGVHPEVIRQTMRHKRLETTTGRYINPDTPDDRNALESFSMCENLSLILDQYLKGGASY